MADDESTRAAVRFIRARLLDRANRIDPVLLAATNIFEADQAARWLLEAHVLMGKPQEYIAQKLGHAREVIQVYEKTFFDVRSALGAEMWIAWSATGLDVQHDGTLLRATARWMGELMLDRVAAVVTGIGRENFSAAELADAKMFVASTRLALRTPGELIPLIRLKQWWEAESVLENKPRPLDLGTGSVARVQRMMYGHLKRRWQAVQNARKEASRRVADAYRMMETVDRWARTLAAGELVAEQYYKHGGQWRKAFARHDLDRRAPTLSKWAN